MNKMQPQMEITPRSVKISDLVKGYVEEGDFKVFAYSGRLDVRPAYQRNEVYTVAQQVSVIDTILKKYPLNIMYWVDKGNDKYEMLDGQQRTLSICKFYDDLLPVGVEDSPKMFSSLSPDLKNRFLNYEIPVWVCHGGTEDEMLAWFERINIAGEKLTPQEIRNATYFGNWVSAAKDKFSKKLNCPAYLEASGYMKGKHARQEYLETAIEWIAGKGDDNIRGYMARHRKDPDANELWLNFKAIIDWVKVTFPTHRSEMKGVDWGPLYAEFKGKTPPANVLDDEVEKLMADDDVKNKRGIYFYVLTRDEKHLNLRTFTDSQKRSAFTRQKGKCANYAKCGKRFDDYKRMHADHKDPWSKGGKTEPKNLQMLCRECNLEKSNA